MSERLYASLVAKTALAYSRIGLASEQFTVTMSEGGAPLRFSDLRGPKRVDTWTGTGLFTVAV